MRENLVPPSCKLEARTDVHTLLWLQKSTTWCFLHVTHTPCQLCLALSPSQWSHLLTSAAAILAPQYRHAIAVSPILYSFATSSGCRLYCTTHTSGVGSRRTHRGKAASKPCFTLVFLWKCLQRRKGGSPLSKAVLSTLSSLSFCLLLSLTLLTERRKNFANMPHLFPPK